MSLLRNGKLSESEFTRLKNEQNVIQEGIIQEGNSGTFSNSENSDSDRGGCRRIKNGGGFRGSLELFTSYIYCNSIYLNL